MAVLLNAFSLSKAVSQQSSVGWTYRWETVMLECPASLIIVNALAPGFPRPCQEHVAKTVGDGLTRKHKLLLALYHRLTHPAVKVIQAHHQYGQVCW